MAYNIIKAHNQSDDMEQLRLKFDSMTSHDITYVGIIQTARASGMTEFPLPYVLTNCHNSLCAVGGTINEDDHKFALSAAHKYGGIYVPTNLANIHSYNRETMAGCGDRYCFACGTDPLQVERSEDHHPGRCTGDHPMRDRSGIPGLRQKAICVFYYS